MAQVQQNESVPCNFFKWADKIAPHKDKDLLIRWSRFGAFNDHVVVRKKKSSASDVGNRGHKGSTSPCTSINSSWGFSADDIKQGGVGDCWFLSALAVVAEKADYIERIVETKELNDKGKYIINLHVDGSWKPWVVDNFLPVVDSNEYKRRRNTMKHTTKKKNVKSNTIENALSKKKAPYNDSKTKERFDIKTEDVTQKIEMDSDEESDVDIIKIIDTVIIISFICVKVIK